MLLLQESYSCLCKAPSPDIHFWDPTISIAESIAREAARIATAFLAREDVPAAAERVSPFILHLFYHARVIYSEKMNRMGREDIADGTDALRQVLVVMDDRWKAAGKSS